MQHAPYQANLRAQKKRLLGLISALFFMMLIAFLSTSVNLNVSREVGRLSTVSNYDDIVYLNKAASAYFLLQEKGCLESAKWLFNDQLHAPFSVLNGLLGYLVFGFSLDRVYYALSTVLFTYLCFVYAIARRLPPFALVGILFASLAIPFATLCSIEFRPDLMWATLLGGAGVILLGTDRAFLRARYGLLVGAILGIILLVKPSTFAMTLVVFGGCWFLSASRSYLTQATNLKAILHSGLLSIIAMLSISGWYWAKHGESVINYFLINSFGAQKDIWVFRGSMSERLGYYFSGAALQSNLGVFFFPLSLLYLSGSFSDIFLSKQTSARLRGASFLWMIVCLAVVNAFFTMKSPYLGGSFYGFLIFGGIWYGVRFLKRILPVIPSSFLLRTTLASLIVTLAWSIRKYPCVGILHKEAASNQLLVNRGLLMDLSRMIPKEGATVMFTQCNPAVPEFLQAELRARGKPMKFLEFAAMNRTMKAMLETMKDADFVVVQDQKIIGAPGDLIPGEALQPELRQYLLSSNDVWSHACDYLLPDGKKVYLFKRNK